MESLVSRLLTYQPGHLGVTGQVRFLTLFPTLPPDKKERSEQVFLADGDRALPLSPLIGYQAHSRPPTHTKRQFLATLELNPLQDLSQICSIIHAYFLTIPNPININWLFSLRKTDCDTFVLRAARWKVHLRLAAPSVSGLSQEDIVWRETLGVLLDATTLTPTSTDLSTDYIEQGAGTLWPKEITPSLPTGQAQFQQSFSLPFQSPTRSARLVRPAAYCGNPTPRPCIDISLDQQILPDSENIYLQPQLSPIQNGSMTAPTHLPINTADTLLLTASTSLAVKQKKEKSFAY